MLIVGWVLQTSVEWKVGRHGYGVFLDDVAPVGASGTPVGVAYSSLYPWSMLVWVGKGLR